MEMLRFAVMLALGLTGICLMIFPLLDAPVVPEEPAPPVEPQDPALWRPS